MPDTNLKVWDSIRSPDPQYVKPIVGKTYKGDSPSPMYMVQLVTQALGPVGTNWSWRIVRTWREEIPDLATGGILRVDVFVELAVNFDHDVEGDSVHQIGSCKQVYQTRDGRNFVDEDAYKKAATDALTKSMSYLGACADIWMDDFDRNQAPAEDETPTKELVGHRLLAVFEARCKGLSVEVDPIQLSKLIAGLDIEKEEKALEANFDRIAEAIGAWSPPEPAAVETARGEADDPVKILRYMHGVISGKFDIEGDQAHQMLKNALPAEFEGDLKRVNTMKLANALIKRTTNLVEHGKPVVDAN